MNNSKWKRNIDEGGFLGFRKAEKWEMPSKRVKIIVLIIFSIVVFYSFYTSYGTINWAIGIGEWAAFIVTDTYILRKLIKKK